jgi:SAM-dependent MidA family methyltransferase
VQGWAAAWQRALYGDRGFYTSGPGGTAGPVGHFRTSVHVGAVFHAAVAALLTEVDARLGGADRAGGPERLDLVDVGAGRGELLAGVLAALPDELAARVRPRAFEVRARPAGLDPRVEWTVGAAPAAVAAAYPTGVRGLLLAHEWLDDLPCDVVEVDAAGTQRLVLVDDAGAEHPGPPLADARACAAYDVDGPAATQWLQRWWPVTLPGARAEVGTARDAAMAALSSVLAEGTLLAIDYGHVRDDRAAGRYDAGTLVGYRAGRAVPPAPDGSTDITAHVAVDAALEATAGLPGRRTLTTQRDALGALGVSGRLPGRDLADDPAAYATALDVASQAAELRDPSGLGAFWWLRLDRDPPR